MARLNTNGSLDTSFNPGSGFDYLDSLSFTEIQNDGKIVIVGAFGSYNGVTRNRFARINNDGTIDSDFNPGTGVGLNLSTNISPYLTTISIQNDGKILIGGTFSSYNGVQRFSIARINGGSSLETDIFEIEDVIVYPNPVQHTFYINLEKEFKGELFDITGKYLMDVNTKEVDISNLNRGIYLLKITSGGRDFTKKIIKK